MQKVQAQGRRGTKNINRRQEMEDKKTQAIRKFLNTVLPHCKSTCEDLKGHDHKQFRCGSDYNGVWKA